MCDTLVALGTATASGATLFGKNSDREPDEAQNIEIIPAADHAPGSTVRCTYITIPQSPHTNRVLLCRPFWMFGAEMGANEHGVAIGNEALFTRVKPGPSALTGMDLLRLALERARTAAEARDTIIALLAEHGQGGNCGYRLSADYNNSFLIADPAEAFVLETVARWWAWKKIADFWTISNVISLTDDFDACAPGLIEHAVKKGWAKNADAFNFRESYSDRLITRGARAPGRETRSRDFLAERRGRLTARDMMNALRDHGADPAWRPDRQSTAAVCMHAKDPIFGRSQTTGSLVAELGPQKSSLFVTGSSNPCLSPFFPVFAPDTALPAGYLPAEARYDNSAYWWQAEAAHRAALSRFRAARAFAAELIGEYESAMLTATRSNRLDQAAIDRHFASAHDLTRQLSSNLASLPPEPNRLLHRLYWSTYNRINAIPSAAG